MTTQLDLIQTRTRSIAELADALVSVLADHASAHGPEAWATKAQCAAWLQCRADLIGDAAAASRGRVLSWPGSPGYKLTRNAIKEQAEHAAAALRHQAIAMNDRAGDILREWHQGGRT